MLGLPDASSVQKEVFTEWRGFGRKGCLKGGLPRKRATLGDDPRGLGAKTAWQPRSYVAAKIQK
jgi:hypothetical protein